MSASPPQWLRSSWPLASVIVAFLIGLTVAGVGGGVLAATFGTLVFGPAYLIQTRIRRRRGTLVERPKTLAEEARANRQALRVGAISYGVIAVVALVMAVSRGHWLPGAGWTTVLSVSAALGASSAPYLWGLSAWRDNGRTIRWAWMLAGALDLAFGLSAAVVAVTNQRNHWIGRTAWTVAFAAFAYLWLVGAVSTLRRLRAGLS